MINTSKIKEMIKLYEKGLTKNQIASALNISRQTLYNYLEIVVKLNIKFCDVEQMSDSEVKELFSYNKKNIPEKYIILSEKFPYFIKELNKTGVTLQLLWEEYIQENPDGYKYSQFCYHKFFYFPKASGLRSPYQ